MGIEKAPAEDRATAIGNMHKKIDEVRPCGFQVIQADKQAETKDRHTHQPSTIFRTPPRIMTTRDT